MSDNLIDSICAYIDGVDTFSDVVAHYGSFEDKFHFTTRFPLGEGWKKVTLPIESVIALKKIEGNDRRAEVLRDMLVVHGNDLVVSKDPRKEALEKLEFMLQSLDAIPMVFKDDLKFIASLLRRGILK